MTTYIDQFTLGLWWADDDKVLMTTDIDHFTLRLWWTDDDKVLMTTYIHHFTLGLWLVSYQLAGALSPVNQEGFWWADYDKVLMTTYIDHFTLSSVAVNGDRQEKGTGWLRMTELKHIFFLGLGKLAHSYRYSQTKNKQTKTYILAIGRDHTPTARDKSYIQASKRTQQSGRTNSGLAHQEGCNTREGQTAD